MSEDFDIFANLNDLQKNIAEQVQLAFERVNDALDESLTFTPPETPEPIGKKKKKPVSKKNEKNAPRDTIEKSSNEINIPEELLLISDTVNQIQPTNRRNTRRNTRTNNNVLNNEATSTNLSTNNSFLDLIDSSSTTNLRRRSRRVMNARRSYYNDLAARSRDIQSVDLITSPIPPINDVIYVDCEPDDDTKNSTVKNKLETAFDEENPEMFIQIIWNGKYETHTLRKYQKFTHIFKSLAERENAAIENLAFNIDTKIIFPDDTPDSIDYKPYQFIKGRVLSTKIDIQNKHNKQLKNDKNTIKVKVQSDQWKHPKLMQVLKTEKFRIFIIKLSEELNIPINNIRLRFDDGIIDHHSTPEEIGMENGDIIDLLLNL